MSKKLISLLLTIILFSTSILNCYASGESVSNSDQISEAIADKGSKVIETVFQNDEKENALEEADNTERWRDYVGDIETFVYGLIIHQYEYAYDVFPAYVDLSDGNSVYGIAYTDYSECYTNEEETECTFEAGFVTFNGELPVSQEEFDSGLYIHDLEYEDKDTSFLWTNTSDQYKEHCVVYNQYLQYGIDDKGAICYETSEYIPGICDESLGSLYSYDDAKYLFDIDVGDYLYISGKSLFSDIDYRELEEEINKLIASQEVNFSSEDIISCANFSQKAVVSYLLSLQEETFLGYNVTELVEEANKLDPMECYRITSEGLVVLELEEENQASNLTKWLVGTGCVILTAAAIVGSVVFIECPGLSAIAGAVAGTAIEILMQVVISGKDLDRIDWRKVALGAIAGATSGYLGPYLASNFGPIAHFALDTAIDGLIGGVERAAEAWMDGADGANILKSFGFGVGMGLALSGGFKVLGKAVSKVAAKISPALKKIVEKLPEKLLKKVSAIKTKIIDGIENLKIKADNTIFHSKHLSEKMAHIKMNRMLSKNKDEILDSSIKQLSPGDIQDLDGNIITKEKLRDLAENAKDGAVIAQYKKGDEIIQIKKQNNMVGIAFDSDKYQTVEIPDGLTKSRSNNMVKAAEQLRQRWKDNTELIPKQISEALTNGGYNVKQIDAKKLLSIIQESDLVLHENIDLLTVTLAPRALHELTSHSGGVWLAKFSESHIAKGYFDRLVQAASTGTVIAVH